MRRPTGFDAPPRTTRFDAPPRTLLLEPDDRAPGETLPVERALPAESATDLGSPAPSPRELRARLRTASRDRRRVEAAEVRRFTRSARRRRSLLAGIASAVVLLLGVPLGLAVSPAFAVHRIVVDGGSAAVTSALRARLDGLVGTPLALVDPAVVRRAVAGVPQIGGYRVSSLPPDTLEVRVVPRAPVGQLRQGGRWVLVDAAGVVLQTSAERLPGRTVLDVPATSGPRFAAAVAVLHGVPASVLPWVATVSAPGADDVRLRLASGLRVRWGGAEDAAAKGAALEAALKHVAHHSTVLDVSAPGLVTVR